MKHIIILFFFSIHFSSYCQTENIAQLKMARHIVSDIVQSELIKITERLKPKDSKLTFFINVSKEEYGYFIAVTTNYDVDINQCYAGFFYLNSKLFLITKESDKIFFKANGEETIKINARKVKAPGLIAEPHIDLLPMWHMKYEHGKLISTYSSY